MPSHSLIFFCLVPFCVSHLQSQNTTDLIFTNIYSVQYRFSEVKSKQSLHQVLVSDFAELHEIRLEAVHLLVDLSVIRDLLPQVLLQLTLAVVDLLHTRLQTLRVALDPDSREWQNYVSECVLQILNKKCDMLFQFSSLVQLYKPVKQIAFIRCICLLWTNAVLVLQSSQDY